MIGTGADLLAVLFAGVGYLVGSIPFSYLVGRAVAGVDIRAHGSGNVGATNLTRIVGLKWGAVGRCSRTS